MKKILLAPVLILIMSCSSYQKKSQKNDPFIYGCPNDGICSIEIEKNKCLKISQDDLNGISYEFQKHNDKTVYIIEYNRNIDQKLIDGHYREQIVFELNNNIENLQLAGDELQEIQMLFGRFCYCKGYTGYYKVRNGRFNLKDKIISIEFAVKEVPQIIEKFSIKIP